MGSLERCPTCGGAMVNDYCQLEDGDIVPDNYCINCGRRPKVTPKCTEPNISDAPYPRNPKQAQYRARKRYGTCSNCGRDNLTLYRDKCWWCNKHGYGPEEARFMVANDMIRPGVGMWHHAISKAGKARPRTETSSIS